jgi:hypothetical protein
MLKVQKCKNVGQAFFVFVYGRADNDDDYKQSKHVKIIFKAETVLCFELLLLSLLRFK